MTRGAEKVGEDADPLEKFCRERVNGVHTDPHLVVSTILHQRCAVKALLSQAQGTGTRAPCHTVIEEE